MVGRQVAQVGRAHHRGGVADRLGVDVVRRGEGAQQVLQIGVALVDELLDRDDVDRHHRLDHRARLRPGAGDDDDVGVLRRFIWRGGGGGGRFLGLLFLGLLLHRLALLARHRFLLALHHLLLLLRAVLVHGQRRGRGDDAEGDRQGEHEERARQWIPAHRDLLECGREPPRSGGSGDSRAVGPGAIFDLAPDKMAKGTRQIVIGQYAARTD